MPSPKQKHPVVVLGCGVAAPAGWVDGSAAQCAPPGPRSGACQAHTIDDAKILDASGLGRRDAKRMDRFSLLAIAAARRALGEAELGPEEHAACGVVTGNVVGGWTFTEPQLRALHTDGLASVSPYLASAWFPAAPQGQITIHLQMYGYAKTVTTDRCAGLQAIGIAFDEIAAGRSTYLLAGGVEAPVTPFVQSAYAQSGRDPVDLSEAAAYLLLGSDGRDGIVVEGHESFAFNTETPPMEALCARLAETNRRNCGTRQIDILVLDAEFDAKIADPVVEVLTTISARPPAAIVRSNRSAGDCLGANSALAAVAAVSHLKRHAELATALVVSFGRQGAALLWLRRAANT